MSRTDDVFTDDDTANAEDRMRQAAAADRQVSETPDLRNLSPAHRAYEESLAARPSPAEPPARKPDSEWRSFLIAHARDLHGCTHDFGGDVRDDSVCPTCHGLTRDPRAEADTCNDPWHYAAPEPPALDVIPAPVREQAETWLRIDTPDSTELTDGSTVGDWRRLGRALAVRSTTPPEPEDGGT